MLTEQTLLLHAATLLMGLHDGRSSSVLAHGGCGIRVLLSSALAGIAGEEATLSILVSGSRGISKHACCSPARGEQPLGRDRCSHPRAAARGCPWPRSCSGTLVIHFQFTSSRDGSLPTQHY